ncbi:MAG TPA: hypothetical protein VGA08_02625 [Candidatus Saccharimonadales bacterium]
MKQVFINIVGYPASKKSTLSKQIATKWPQLNVIDGGQIRKLLNQKSTTSGQRRCRGGVSMTHLGGLWTCGESNYSRNC